MPGRSTDLTVQRKWIRRAAVLLVVLIIFLFLGKELWKNWRQIPLEQISFNYWLIIFSYICMFVSFAVYAGVWKVVLAAYGAKLSVLRSFQILATSQLGKYLPGKVWFTVGRMYLARQFEIPERVSITSVVLEIILMVISGLMIALLTVAAPWAQNFPVKHSLLALAIIVCGLIVTYPGIFNRLVGLATRVLKRESVQMNLTYGGIVVLLLLYSVHWFWQGMGFFLLIRSFYEIEIAMWPLMWGLYAAAWIIGFVSFLTPAGIGVREGVMTFFLSFYMPLSIAIIVALLARVWSTVADVLFFTVSLPAVRKWRTVRVEADGS